MYRRKEEGRCIKTPLDTNTPKQHVVHFYANPFLIEPSVKLPSIYLEGFSSPSHWLIIPKKRS